MYDLQRIIWIDAIISNGCHFYLNRFSCSHKHCQTLTISIAISNVNKFMRAASINSVTKVFSLQIKLFPLDFVSRKKCTGFFHSICVESVELIVFLVFSQQAIIVTLLWNEWTVWMLAIKLFQKGLSKHIEITNEIKDYCKWTIMWCYSLVRKCFR